MNIFKEAVSHRTEKILAEMEMKNDEVKRLRKAKSKLFSQASTDTKDIFMENEELESRERIIAAETVYIQAVNDTLDTIK